MVERGMALQGATTANASVSSWSRRPLQPHGEKHLNPVGVWGVRGSIWAFWCLANNLPASESGRLVSPTFVPSVSPTTKRTRPVTALRKPGISGQER